ncbi:hypothetical protein ACOME3_000897 [Neoechinorhynchus agilis]
MIRFPPIRPYGLKIIIDYPSPNIAKDMHVGHLRSAVIGESLNRLFTKLGNTVIGLNHLGDWGTQFGMLITHLQEMYGRDIASKPVSELPSLDDLVRIYREAKIRFDEEKDFHQRSLEAVVRLQSHQEHEIRLWKLICDTSLRNFSTLFRDLGVNVVDRGESFYQPLMGPMVADLREKGILSNENGCFIMHTYPDREDKVPLILVKSDGGYTYDTSDLTALKHRIIEEEADWILYVVDAGQAQHFDNVFRAARIAGWIDPELHRVEHVAFGVVLGENMKKLKTRSGETVKKEVKNAKCCNPVFSPKFFTFTSLAQIAEKNRFSIVILGDLLETGLVRASMKVNDSNRFLDIVGDKSETIEKAKRSIAYGCIKYADLSHNRLKDYVFSFDRMLDDRGNTAVYLMYSLTRILSIGRKVPEGVDVHCDKFLREQLSESFSHEAEWNLLKVLIKYEDIVSKVANDFLIHSMCEYLYELAGVFSDFYDNCYCIEKDQITGEVKKVHCNRITLCAATEYVMRTLFYIVGLEPLDRM